MAPFERAMVVSYSLLPIVTIALSLTIRPQFAIECLWRSNQQEVRHFGENMRRKGLTDGSQILTQSKTCDIFCRLSTVQERDRQTTEH